MPLFAALRSFLVGRPGLSPVQLRHPCCVGEKLSEGLVSKNAPLISSLFPAYLPLVNAIIFACANLTSSNATSARPEQRRRPILDFFGRATSAPSWTIFITSIR
jgi:hypothetical protein